MPRRNATLATYIIRACLCIEISQTFALQTITNSATFNCIAVLLLYYGSFRSKAGSAPDAAAVADATREWLGSSSATAPGLGADSRYLSILHPSLEEERYVKCVALHSHRLSDILEV